MQPRRPKHRRLDYSGGIRPALYEGDSAAAAEVHSGRGAGTILAEILEVMHEGSGRFVAFPDLVEECVGHIESIRGADLYDWGRVRWNSF